MRPHNGRARGYHSMPMSVALALFLASLVIIVFLICGGGN